MMMHRLIILQILFVNMRENIQTLLSLYMKKKTNILLGESVLVLFS